MDLRKVALVVGSLDRETADRLLDEIPEAQAQRVRDAMMELSSIPAGEARTAIAEFLRVQPSDFETEGLAQLAAANSTDSHVDSSNQLRDSGSPHLLTERFERRDTSGDPSPIKRASERVIADCLRGELPQAIAVALTDLPAHRASEVVSHLPATLQAEVLERMVELPAEAQSESPEMRAEFRSWLNEQIERSLRRAELANRLATILNATHHRARARIMDNVSSSDAQLAKELELKLSETRR